MKKIIVFALVLALRNLPAQSTNFTVHEWGTFTSVQGGDGNLILWQPLQTSELPRFVYNWANPGLGRFNPSLVGGKGGMVTLQRMETPVIYFYSPAEMNVDVSVGFPLGTITEWYPQATQIGPANSMNTNGPSNYILKESRAVWKNLLIIPEGFTEQPPLLPLDKSGSHYFAARETGADLVQARFPGLTNASENEKFIFYRGAGNFATPLQVSVNPNNAVTVQNNGTKALSHLLLVSLHDGKGAFAELDDLPASNSVPWLNLDSLAGENWKRYPLVQFQGEIGARMAAALTDEGLFADEARAMVNTWKDSWFTEEGERVLYILPRTWTDETLPMAITPKPQNLVRVMVGRAEIITPTAVKQLNDALTAAANGDAGARKQAIAKFKGFGRFAASALQIAYQHSNATNKFNSAYQLFDEATRPKASAFE